MIRLFMQTDLPEPVVPAMSRWGSLPMSPTMLMPPISLPTAKESRDLARLNTPEPMTSRAYTVDTSLLGTSMPTTEILSGIAEIRTPDAPRLRAISSAKPVILDSFTPRSNSSSYLVMEGPRVTFTIWASILKLFRVSSRRFAFSRISEVPSSADVAGGESRSSGGNTYCGGALSSFSLICWAISMAEAFASSGFTFWGICSTNSCTIAFVAGLGVMCSSCGTISSGCADTFFVSSICSYSCSGLGVTSSGLQSVRLFSARRFSMS